MAFFEKTEVSITHSFFNALKIRFPNSTFFLQKALGSALCYTNFFFSVDTWTLSVVPEPLELAIVQQEFVRIINRRLN